VFEKELKYIKDLKIKQFVAAKLETTPDYFFSIPASSTGKYHPAYSLGEGGLVRHTRACVRIALELFRLDMFKWMTEENKDIIVGSLILHDTYKNGLGESKFTVTEHPLVAESEIKEFNKSNEFLTEEQLDLLTGNIASHMGQWTDDFKTGLKVLEKPKTKIQNFVHLVDYLASRKCLEMNFDVELAR
jgi:hypothetical protein